MLGKLIKHDFRALSRTLFPLQMPPPCWPAPASAAARTFNEKGTST